MTSGHPINYTTLTDVTPGQAEITLQDVLTTVGGVGGSVGSSVGGLPLSVIVHPDNPDWLIIQIPASFIAADTGSRSVGAVALTNTATNESVAYNVDVGSTGTLVDGVAAGTSMLQTGDKDTTWDIKGNTFPGISIGTSVLCFARGTLIDTLHGPLPVQCLKPGDQVATQSNGYQPVRWIGRTRVGAIQLWHQPLSSARSVSRPGLLETAVRSGT